MSAVARLVGPKDVFKHHVLGQLLRKMALRQEVNFNYYDFAPGPGQYQVIENETAKTLPQVFAYDRKLFDERKVNPFHSYIEDIACFNSGRQPTGIKQPPPPDYSPVVYPSNAGLASLHLGERDRAIFVEPKKDNREKLSNLFKDEKRVHVIETNSLTDTVQLSKVLVPPIHHRGLVSWDLDALIEDIPPTTPEGPNSQYAQSHALQMDEAASILHSIFKRWPTCTMFIPYPMTSHIPPISVVRTILNSGAMQVLNCSVFWEKKGATPGLAVGALIVNPPPGFDSDMEEQLKTFQAMFVPEGQFNPKKEVARVYFVNIPRDSGVDKPTMTGTSAPTNAPEVPENFDAWVHRDPVREEKELLDSMGKFSPPSSFPDTPEGGENKRAWQRFMTDQIAAGQKPQGHTVIQVPKKEQPPPAPPAPVNPSRFRKKL